MFTADPKGRADLKEGTLYAVSGEEGWIYYGQITTAKRVGFFKRRDLKVAQFDQVLKSEVMCQVIIDYSSIGRAVRRGAWKRLGRFQLHSALLDVPDTVQWPVGTLAVTVWSAGQVICTTRVEEPDIQELEIIAAWDAISHIPERLTADFGSEPAQWHVGGPVWRQRQVKEAYAARFPTAPYHQLPADWVPTKVGEG